MRTLARLVLVLVVCAATGRAAGQGTSSLIEVDLDHATFAFDADRSLLEVYLAFGAETLPFDVTEEGFRARVPLQLAVVRSTEAALTDTPTEPVHQDTLSLNFVLPDTSALGVGQYFVHQVRVPVQPGEYELRVVIPGDRERGRQELELRRDILVPNFAREDLVGLSDITLASSIEPSQDRENVFFKNGLLIRPNANQLYGQGLNQLYYYAEAYNVGEVASDDGQYTVLVYVAEANRPQPLPDVQRRMQREARTPDVLAGAFDVSSLPSGSYFLRLAVLDENNESMAEQSRKFFVFNPDVEREPVEPLTTSFESSPYATMTEGEVEQALDHISLIATEREQRRAGNIQDLDERRRFLMDFWKARDPEPTTPLNEYKEEFYARLQYVNQRYATGRREGWETDRGRVFVKYGTPANIEPHLYDRGAKPHEIWQYNNIPGEGQAVFIFADTDGFGDFELLHSSVAGERKSPSWQADLRQ